jgi:hypothetical protein
MGAPALAGRVVVSVETETANAGQLVLKLPVSRRVGARHGDNMRRGSGGKLTRLHLQSRWVGLNGAFSVESQPGLNPKPSRGSK